MHPRINNSILRSFAGYPWNTVASLYMTAPHLLTALSLCELLNAPQAPQTGWIEYKTTDNFSGLDYFQSVHGAQLRR